MKKYIPIFIICAVIAIFFQQFLLKNLLPIPSDTIIGLYHPFRDLYAIANPNGIPYKNFLITDPVRQQYPWRYLTVELEKLGQLPLWNPYSFAGYPLLANVQSAPFYPLNILFFALPFSFAWSLLIFLQPILGAIFLYCYLRSLRIRIEASLLGSLVFVFSGFFIVWLEWNTVLQVVIWLPLIFLAKDKLLFKWTWQWGIVFFFAEVAAFFGGHLQILFYCLCLSNLYLFLRIYQKATKDKLNHKEKILKRIQHDFLSILKIYIPFLLVGIAVFTITAIQWLPALQLIQLSARSLDQSPFTTEGWFLPYQNLVQFVVPDFFGNPTTLNYWGVWNYAELVGYIGIIPLIFALFAMVFRHDKKTYLFTIVTILSLLLALPTYLGQIPFLLHIPLFSTSQPTRLLFVIDLSLAILAALGFDYFLQKRQKSILFILVFFSIIYGGLWIFILHFSLTFGISPDNLHTAKQNLVFPTLLFLATGFLICFFLCIKKRKIIQVGCICLLGIIFIIDATRFAVKFTPFTPSKYLFPSTSTIAFLQKNIGNNRLLTTDSQILPPNFAVYYHLQSVDGYDPLYLMNYAQLIAASEREKPDINPPFGFNRIITPHNFNSRIIDLLGVKYVLTLSDEKNSKLKKVFQEGQTQVYKNTQAFPRAFFVKSIDTVGNNQGAIDALFNSMIDLHTSAILERVLDTKNFTQGIAKITHFSANKVSIVTQNSGDGFLVFTDIFYPTWYAKIDGKETKIYQTDFAFRGVFVPSGKHTLVFYDKLF